MPTPQALNAPPPSWDNQPALMPSGAKHYLLDPRLAGQNALAPLATGRLMLQARQLFQGEVITSVTFMSGTTAGATLTHTWGSLWSSALAKLAVTNDDTAASWTASSTKTLTYSSPYTVPSTGLYYFGLVVVGTTMPTLMGVSSPVIAINTLAPIFFGTSSTGQTVPGSAPATAAAITPLAGGAFGWCS